MRHLAYSFWIVLGLVMLNLGVARAGWYQFRGEHPQVNQHVSQAVTVSTHITGVTVSSLSAVISTSSIELHAVIINNPGVNSLLEIFNSRMSTSTGGRFLFASIDTSTTDWKSSVQDKYYYTVLDSGCIINNTGFPAADITLTFRKR